MKKTTQLLIAFITAYFLQSAYAFDQPNLEVNKKNVTEFYEAALNQKDFEAAKSYLGPYYTQHNPTAADGINGLKAFIQFMRERYPNAHSEIIRVIAERDYVVLHVHSIREPGTKGRAIFDLFRLENGKIVEHWDTIQDIPEKAANTNGMF